MSKPQKIKVYETEGHDALSLELACNHIYNEDYFIAHIVKGADGWLIIGVELKKVTQ